MFFNDAVLGRCGVVEEGGAPGIAESHGRGEGFWAGKRRIDFGNRWGINPYSLDILYSDTFQKNVYESLVVFPACVGFLPFPFTVSHNVALPNT